MRDATHSCYPDVVLEARLRRPELLDRPRARDRRRALDAPDRPRRLPRAAPLRPVPGEPRDRPQRPHRPARTGSSRKASSNASATASGPSATSTGSPRRDATSTIALAGLRQWGDAYLSEKPPRVLRRKSDKRRVIAAFVPRAPSPPRRRGRERPRPGAPGVAKHAPGFSGVCPAWPATASPPATGTEPDPSALAIIFAIVAAVNAVLDHTLARARPAQCALATATPAWPDPFAPAWRLRDARSNARFGWIARTTRGGDSGRMVAAGASQIPEACKHVSSSHAGDGLTAGVGQPQPRGRDWPA